MARKPEPEFERQARVKRISRDIEEYLASRPPPYNAGVTADQLVTRAGHPRR
jgi:hypothetical protein